MNEILLLALLAVIGLIAGVINTIAGGGSLLTLPMLIFMGLPPAVANGTNRIGVFIQTITAAAGYKSKGIRPTIFSLFLGISALIGSLIGAKIAIDINENTFNKILAIVMLVVVVLLVFKPKTNMQDLTERIQGKYKWISIIVFFFIGIYGGFIQAGVGFIILLALSIINRLSLVHSNAIKAIVVLIFTFGALIIFMIEGQINYLYGFVLAIGNAAGGWIASRWSVHKGEGLVKVFLVIMVLIMSINLWLK